MKINEEALPTRCEVCHQSDLFNPLENKCSRCLNLVSHKNSIKPANNTESQMGIFLLGWALFAVSMLLPAVGATSNEQIPGWYCALVAFSAFFADVGKNLSAFYLSLLSLCNIAMVLSVIFGLAARKGKESWYRTIMFIATILVCCTSLVYNEMKFTIGHYVWCLSFILVSFAFCQSKKPKKSVFTYKPNR